MEVVMGRCFPLTGPGHQLGADFPVVKGVVYKGEKTPDSLVSKNLNGKDNYSTARSPAGEVPRLSEQGPGPGKVLSPHQNGVPHDPKQPATVTHDQRFSSKEREPSLQKEEEATGDKREVHSNEKPKMQSILRRTSSSSDPEGRDSSESLKTPDGKGKQDCGREREPSWGKRAWEMTQRRKAQMREEFFKVPYEECNKEAARSLGGRLNKSEPRLHTLGKDRKKRNSLSYKRRVHFDLDYNEDEDDRKPRCRSKSFEAPDPPKKVVVSIYSIDKPKSVIQPDALLYCSAPGGPPQAVRDTTNTRTRSARPTDLDSLKQKVHTDVADRQQLPDNTEQPDSKTDKQTRPQLNQRITPTTAALHPSSGRATTPLTDATMARSDNLTHTSPLRPPAEHTVRARHTPPSPLPSIPNNPATPCSPQLSSKTSSFIPEQPTLAPAPIPAPRSHLTKSHSLPGHNRPSLTSHSHETPPMSSQPSRPRPDRLNLNSPSSARAAVHVFTPTKTFIHPQEPTPTRTDLTTPLTHVPSPSTAATPILATPTTSKASNTPATPSTPVTSTIPSVSSITPACRSPMSHSAPHTPSTPHSLPHFLSHSNGPVPMPRKRISVSQQTLTPQSSPHKVSASLTPTTAPPPTSASHTTRQTLHHNTQTTVGKKADSNTTLSNKPQESSTNTVPLKKHNKENDAARLNQKTSGIDRENSVNILMTKGESYAKHNIIISSHKSTAPPSVTVRKVFIPVSAPSRSSPSPTPSCASSSCSFGSSGSSSGCYSGSPSPTPTPSPTRIRASCAPTDL